MRVSNTSAITSTSRRKWFLPLSARNSLVDPPPASVANAPQVVTEEEETETATVPGSVSVVATTPISRNLERHPESSLPIFAIVGVDLKVVAVLVAEEDPGGRTLVASFRRVVVVVNANLVVMSVNLGGVVVVVVTENLGRVVVVVIANLGRVVVVVVIANLGLVVVVVIAILVVAVNEILVVVVVVVNASLVAVVDLVAVVAVDLVVVVVVVTANLGRVVAVVVSVSLGRVVAAVAAVIGSLVVVVVVNGSLVAVVVVVVVEEEVVVSKLMREKL